MGIAKIGFWIAVAAVSIIGLQRTTLTEMYYSNFIICVAFVLLVVVTNLYDNRRAIDASEAQLGALNAAYMGLIWTWGGVAIALLYTTVISWKEWWQFVIGFGTAATGAFLFAALLAYRPNGSLFGTSLTKIARITAWVQLIAMVITMLGLIIDNKMDKLGWNWAVRDNPPNDWAANNAFWVGAAGLAVISLIALRYGERAHYRDESVR